MSDKKTPTNRVRTIQSLMNGMKKDSFYLEPLCQRNGGQWNKEQKVLLIDSIFEKIAIPSITFLNNETFVDENEGGTDDYYVMMNVLGNICKEHHKCMVLDGKQRLLTLDEFINNDGFKYNDKLFSEMSEEEKDIILNTEIPTITYYELDYYDTLKVFNRLNNGTPISKSEKLKSNIDPRSLMNFNILTEHKFITEYCNFTSSQLRKREDLNCILQTIIILYIVNKNSFKEQKKDKEYGIYDYYKNHGGTYIPNLTSSNISKYFIYDEREDGDPYRDSLNINEDDLQEIQDEIFNRMDFLYNFLKETGYEGKQKNLKKIHIPTLIASTDIVGCEHQEEFKNRLIDFIDIYNGENKKFKEYKSHCVSGTTQKEHVVGRMLFWIDDYK